MVILKYANIVVFINLFTACDRTKKFKEVDKKTNKSRTEKLKYLEIYSTDYQVKKGKSNFIVDVTITVTNKSNKKIFWFKVLVNIYSNGQLTHSIIYTPNYYPAKDGKMYYRVLAPKQTGIFTFTLGEQYNIKEKPTNVVVTLYEIGDNLDIFKKIRVNPKKYFIPYTPE